MSAQDAQRKRDEDTPYVTIDGQKIDGRDQQALDDAFRRVARQRDWVVTSYTKHFNASEK